VIAQKFFKNFADQDWIGFNFCGSGLDSDRKISQSAHPCSAPAPKFMNPNPGPDPISFKSENPTAVQTLASIDATEFYP